MIFAKKCIFMVLAEKYILWVWRKNTFYGFGGKIRFCDLDGKSVF